MTTSSDAFALAARAHDGNGDPSSSPALLGRMRAAVAALGQAGRRILAGPTGIVGETTLVLQLTSPEAVVPAVLALAASVRPARTTFCACRAGASSSDLPPAGDPMEAALAAAERAAGEATRRIEETDLREARVLVVGSSEANLVGAILGLVLESYDSMTDRQRQIIELARDSRTQQQVATHLGISRQAVNQSLSSAGWPHIQRAESAASHGLAALWCERDSNA
jgi:DNA-binding phage protein